jgi:hypothetical protein
VHDLHDRGIVDLMSDLGHLLEDPSACKSCIPKQTHMHWALAIKFVRATAAPKRKTRRTADAEDTLAAVLGAWTSRALNSGSDDASSPSLCENRAG